MSNAQLEPRFKIRTKGEGQVFHRCMRLAANKRGYDYRHMHTDSDPVPIERRREIAEYATVLTRLIRER